ncbi:hypothetical protein NMK71_07440 [Weeksellaceae bacterium KMM 9713]|uniref:Lipoprotein n=1 Tax=Profundicola chukchiensis TaxID=2961959 RepID=A0A9X4RWV5_9FLAO|nr:hypothetical protein [Profundicola chukchiensis]MDG4946242.1 hypothetical protein [Profundicola chukchiensis]
MKKIIGILIFTLILTSCSDKVVADFEIMNNTEFNIDSLKIEPNISDVGKYISLKKGEKAVYKSDMTTIAKTDGAYQISFLVNGINKTQVFGYYTNGYPLERITKINIEKDTILIDQVFEKD